MTDPTMIDSTMTDPTMIDSTMTDSIVTVPSRTQDPIVSSLGEPKRFIVPRQGDRDLAFTGWRLSREQDCQSWSRGSEPSEPLSERCTSVSIYLTEGHTIITHVTRWEHPAGGEAERDHEEHKVGVHSPTDRDRDGNRYNRDGAARNAVRWLKSDNDGVLAALSKKAWVEACRVCPELAGQEVEEVD